MTGVFVSEPAQRGQSLLAVMNSLLRHRRLLAGLPLSFAIAAIGIGLLLARSYTASASFTPQDTAGATGRLIGLAAQFGFPVGGSVASSSPEFYAALVESPEILRELVRSKYPSSVDSALANGAAQDSTGGIDLVTYFEVNEDTPELSRERAVEELAEVMDVSVSRQTGVVTLRVTTKSAAISWGIAKRAIQLIDQFNVSVRQSQAAAERSFVEGRLSEARQALRSAEDELQAFQLRNRLIQGAPDLMLIHERLQREVALQQQLFVTLAQAYEQARIDEVRNTPVITMIEQPILPVADRRGLGTKAVVAFFIGGFIALLIALMGDFVMSGTRGEDEEQKEYQRLVTDLRDDVRRLIPGSRRRRAPAS